MIMNFITLESGVKFSEIALGAGGIGPVERDDFYFKLMDRYVELGGTTFDSARIYGGGECDFAIGRWLKSRGCRDNVTVITKGSHPDTKTMFVSRLSDEEISYDIDTSLAAMGIECSDIHILHRDDIRIPAEQIVDSLNKLVTSGKTRSIGVSNWTASRIIQANRYAKEAGKIPVTCTQAHFSLAVTTPQGAGDLTYVPLDEIETAWYKESRQAVLAFSPQARGWFVARANGKVPKESPRRNYDDWPENHRRLQRLMKLSAESGYSLSALTTAYVRDSGMNAVPLCSYSSIEQLEDSLGALKFKLTKEQVDYLERGEI